MFWKINYIIDDGYDWHKNMCIIKADSKEKALELLNKEIVSKLKGERMILDKYTKIAECDNDVVLYNSTR